MKYYHADNRTYNIAKYKAEVEDSKQTLVFYEVRSHYQNRWAENRIKIIYA